MVKKFFGLYKPRARGVENNNEKRYSNKKIQPKDEKNI